MGRKPADSKKKSTSKPRRKRAEPKSKGLAVSECIQTTDNDIQEARELIEGAGGAILTSYRDPLGGQPVVLAALPIDRVAPTPFQRDLSEAHAKRLADTIGKLGRFLDPIIAVPAGDQFWTPNGRHRLEAMIRLGARTVIALVLPDADIQYKILALNVEKAHNVKEKSLEVIRMYRSMAAAGTAGIEGDFALEFEEPAFATLGVCYESNGRFAGGAYNPILRRVDRWIDEPLDRALPAREARAHKIERLDARVSEIVQALKAKGFQSPYLKGFVIARVNPLRFMKELPPFDDALDGIIKRADRFNVDKVKQTDIAASAAPFGDDDA